MISKGAESVVIRFRCNRKRSERWRYFSDVIKNGGSVRSIFLGWLKLERALEENFRCSLSCTSADKLVLIHPCRFHRGSLEQTHWQVPLNNECYQRSAEQHTYPLPRIWSDWLHVRPEGDFWGSLQRSHRRQCRFLQTFLFQTTSGWDNQIATPQGHCGTVGWFRTYQVSDSSRGTYSRCSKCNHHNRNWGHPLIISIYLKQQRPLPLLLFIKALTELLEDGISEKISLWICQIKCSTKCKFKHSRQQ